MTQPTAMYGMDAFHAMETDNAMTEFIAFLDSLQPEIRSRVEARLRGRYGGRDQRSVLLESAFARQAAQAASAYPAQYGSGFAGILGVAGLR